MSTLSTRVVRSAVGLVTAATLAAGSAGCGADAAGPASAAGASAGAGSVAEQAAVVWREFAECARRHGLPNLPDPQVDASGHVQFGAGGGGLKRALDPKGPSTALKQACGRILDRLPPSAQKNRPTTQAELQATRQYAACMRQHGVTEWPDPNSDGTFPLSARLLAQAKRLIVGPGRACKHILDDAGVNGVPVK
jgi:hypothetical protein